MFSIKTLKLSILTITLSIALFIGCKAVPDDNAVVKPLKAKNLMGTQYTEILPVWGNAITKKLTAGVYNTLTLNNPDATGNTSPDAKVAKMDLGKVKKEYKALKVILNGPRIWTVDWIEVNSGKIRNFDGLDAYWVMWFYVPKGFKGGESPYQKMEGNRDTHMGIKAGSPAIILDDPDGTSWVMKSMSRVQHPEQKFSDLKNLGAKLKLPTGWKWRYVILEKELVFQPDNGKAWITQDDMGNTYDRVSGNFSNYKP
jgi:hypothetical protein